jgi:hypothetical protein
MRMAGFSHKDRGEASGQRVAAHQKLMNFAASSSQTSQSS